ncbi:MAG: ABC transporter permease [Candidatus Pedobacter colombiensis]|uniref:Transport permease protein n=1 Tax=Candidatus Pedobacter colombiensis TaxID=3121371 RepID=A0AAJ5W7H6_9SPHI|nr:ABC transporter permease [Pedobacter sp.]WEK19419.1 MAG: ABC transporter permease [Pedobacter sp.]
MNFNEKEDITENWQWEINSTQSWFKLGLRDLYSYRGLIMRFVRRDLIASYQQTIIGPVWMFLQPLLTTSIYFVVFGNFAKVSTDGVPKILFYLSGTIIWTFFFDNISGTMYTFITNAQIFNKVYFPRLIMPISNIITQSVRLSIQLMLFVLIFLFYHILYDQFQLSYTLLLIPLLIILTAAFALGSGLLISVFTARYRDVDTFFQYILRLGMFVTPVVFPSSIVPLKYQFLFWLNPLTPIIETFRAVFFNHGAIQYNYLLLAVVNTTILLILGLAMFKKRETEVMDII